MVAPVTKSKMHTVKEVGGVYQNCKHQSIINLTTAEQLNDPIKILKFQLKKWHQKRKGDLVWEIS